MNGLQKIILKELVTKQVHRLEKPIYLDHIKLYMIELIKIPIQRLIDIEQFQIQLNDIMDHMQYDSFLLIDGLFDTVIQCFKYIIHKTNFINNIQHYFIAKQSDNNNKIIQPIIEDQYYQMVLVCLKVFKVSTNFILLGSKLICQENVCSDIHWCLHQLFNVQELQLDDDIITQILHCIRADQLVQNISGFLEQSLYLFSNSTQHHCINFMNNYDYYNQYRLFYLLVHLDIIQIHQSLDLLQLLIGRCADLLSSSQSFLIETQFHCQIYVSKLLILLQIHDFDHLISTYQNEEQNGFLKCIFIIFSLERMRSSCTRLEQFQFLANLTDYFLNIHDQIEVSIILLFMSKMVSQNSINNILYLADQLVYQKYDSYIFRTLNGILILANQYLDKPRIINQQQLLSVQQIINALVQNQLHCALQQYFIQTKKQCEYIQIEAQKLFFLTEESDCTDFQTLMCKRLIEECNIQE